MLNTEETSGIKMPKIALFLPSLEGGGAERVMVSLANGFVARGLNVDLVLIKKKGVFLADVNPQIRIIDLNASRTLACFFSLISYFRRENPAIMLSALNHVNVVAIWAKLMSRASTRMVISEHANLSHSLQINRSAIQKVIPWFMKKTYPRADALIAVSDGVAEDLSIVLNLHRSRISTIYNPIETEKLIIMSHSPIDNSWLNNKTLPIIIGAGRLDKAKDFPMLIQAFNHVRLTTAARLVILGEGTERKLLESLVEKSPYKNDILLPGFQRNPYSWMRAASVFVSSSQFEGLCNVLVEAMACGTPVVSTACPSGPDEILEGGRWGRLVPVGNPIALATAINATLMDPSLPDVKKRATDFNVEKAVDAYLKLLCRLDPEILPVALWKD